MQDIEIVLENLASQEVTPDQAQQLFLEAFIEFDSKYKQTSFFRKNSNPWKHLSMGSSWQGQDIIAEGCRCKLL